MKKHPLIITAILILTGHLWLPAMSCAANDPFAEAGFLRAKSKVAALDFTLEDLNGKKVKMADFQGKTVLLYFWATW